MVTEEIDVKYIKISAIFMMLITGLILNVNTSSAAKKTSGKDEYGNEWSYDKETKTLTFTGEGKVGADFQMDGHAPEPDWFVWNDKATKVVFAGNITEIGNGTCDGFWYIKTIEFPESLEKIGIRAFTDCLRLVDVNFPDSLRVLGEDSFSGCDGLKEIKLNDGLEVIGDGALSANMIKSITIPDTVKKIDDSAFQSCMNLKKVKLPENLESIGSGAFSYCPKLKKLSLPKKMKKIGTGAFSFSGIEKIVIPENVQLIYQKKYSYLLPEERGLFVGCKKLKKVIIKSKKLTKIAKRSFYKTNKKVKIYVPKKMKKKYKKLFRNKGKLSKNVKILVSKEFTDRTQGVCKALA